MISHRQSTRKGVLKNFLKKFCPVFWGYPKAANPLFYWAFHLLAPFWPPVAAILLVQKHVRAHVRGAMRVGRGPRDRGASRGLGRREAAACGWCLRRNLRGLREVLRAKSRLADFRRLMARHGKGTGRGQGKSLVSREIYQNAKRLRKPNRRKSWSAQT